MEILATLDDINANLPSIDDKPVIEATDESTALIQLSVARVVRGYLSGVVDSTTLMSWDSPDNTPDIVREIASMLIAAQVYFNYAARTNLTIDDDNFAQRMYDKAVALLQRIVDGLISLGPVVIEPTDALGSLDYHPVDDTDRAFTMNLQL